MNRKNPQCWSCESYIEKGPRRCKQVAQRHYIVWCKDYCPCIKCLVKAVCSQRDWIYDSANQVGIPRCDLIHDSIGKYEKFIGRPIWM